MNASTVINRVTQAVRRRLTMAASRISRQPLSPPANRALLWIVDNHLPTGGIRVQSGDRNAYPEVTGYLVPTLIEYGHSELAAELVRWLICVQREDGSFTDPAQGEKYVFDTGQALRGLLAGRSLVPQAEEAARRAAEYLREAMIDGGRGGFPVRYAGSGCPESVHLYVLPPLMEAAGALHLPGYRAAAERCLNYYVRHSDFLRVDDLTHFLAYEIEALISLGRCVLAEPVLNELEKQQRPDGSVRGAGGVRWVCVPGLAQLALCWYRLGRWEPADRAMEWLDRHQTSRGGFRGSHGWRASYKPRVEVSWANKFYLDAHRLRVREFFGRNAAIFPDLINSNDGRLQAVLAHIGPTDLIVEVGCGKGRFLRAIKAARPKARCTGIDPSPVLAAHLPSEFSKMPGTLESIPLPDDSHDVVFSVEAIEHTANPDGAVAEMIRVARPGGWVIIVDKHRARWGERDCPPWEHWPGKEHLCDLLRCGCDEVRAVPVGSDGGPSTGLMIAWQGRKRSRLTGQQWNAAMVPAEIESQIIDSVRYNRLYVWTRAVILQTRPGHRVLEIGSGTGEISLQMAQAGRRVTCLDLSRQSLAFVRRCAQKLKLPIATVCADATAPLPFADGEFDVVWSSGLLEHFDAGQRQAMLRQWARVCRGKVVNLVPNASAFAYRLGKRLRECRGTWPYGLEMPIASLRDDCEAAGLRVLEEQTLAPEHAITFLHEHARSVERKLTRLLRDVPPTELATWNQGYLLLTVAEPVCRSPRGDA